MNKIGKLIGWVWAICFLSYFAIVLLKLNGLDLPDVIERYGEVFQSGLTWFLSSWLFGFVFVAGWVGVCYHLAKNSGWKELAGQFSNQLNNIANPENQVLGSGQIGKTQHNGMLRIGVNTSGVMLSVLLLFRFGHPKLFISWEDIESIKIQLGSSKNPNRNIWSKLEAKYSPFHYANFRLKKLPEQIMIIHWKKEFEKFIPPELIIT